jgi:branched-chain amino acid transport system ATP-binding protein
MSSALLHVDKLDAGYGDTQILNGISLQVEDGEFVAVLGPNGAGKTTLLRALTGLVRPSAGRVAFGAAAITDLPTHRLTRAGIAIVPEGKQLWPDLTIHEHLVVAQESSGRSRAMARQQFAFVHDLLPLLRERRGARVGTLSGGQQQMVAIGRALMAAPKLLLLDEPSIGLSPKVTQEVFAAIGKLRAGGLSVLLIEQNIGAALELVDRAYLMTNGRIVRSGSATELRTVNLETVFLH